MELRLWIFDFLYSQILIYKSETLWLFKFNRVCTFVELIKTVDDHNRTILFKIIFIQFFMSGIFFTWLDKWHKVLRSLNIIIRTEYTQTRLYKMCCIQFLFNNTHSMLWQQEKVLPRMINNLLIFYYLILAIFSESDHQAHLLRSLSGSSRPKVWRVCFDRQVHWISLSSLGNR